ncbi:tRNA dihydrouridine synthase [Desulfohalovibrio reitneri]|uniref:tRNA dihydrouridine synthase n=1 Tax=Desulfohalovibrio reitneri TaxID=1307759 RepID=UPI0004A75A59|nr:tRNA-dihydrouridine synthase family protein [Desulfohalovibrio reitneri]
MNPPLPPIGPEHPWLAPLAGFSDLSFRLLCREFGAACSVTEMVSAKGLLFGSPGTAPLLRTMPEDSPLVVQLFGADPEYLGRAADRLLEQGFRYFDLNAGCPVKKVVTAGAGAALVREPERLAKLASVLVERVGAGRVGVKFRHAFGGEAPVHLEIGRRLADAGAAWLTLHPRTARQGYAGRAHWEKIEELASAVDVPILASGDLFSARDALDCLKSTGCSGVMYARGALRNPAVFADHAALLRGGEETRRDGRFLASLIRRHAELLREHGEGDRRDVLKMRTILPRYLRFLQGAKDLRRRAVDCQDWDGVERIAGLVARLPASSEEETA